MDVRERWQLWQSRAAAALTSGDERLLGQASLALDHEFFRVLVGAEEEARQEFVRKVGEVLARDEAWSLLPSGAPRYAGEWAHLVRLVGLAADRLEEGEEARRVVAGRRHGWRLLEALAESGSAGKTPGDLARCLKISPQVLARLNTVMEEHGLIQRRRVGRNRYLTITLRGVLALRRRG
jgi:hypothetical protein